MRILPIKHNNWGQPAPAREGQIQNQNTGRLSVYMTLLILFIVLNAFNVVIQTVKSLCTVKCGKTIAAIVNALAYGLYTVVLVYMQCDLSTLAKALVVGGCNLVGVYIVKVVEEKLQKEKLWKVELTIKNDYQTLSELTSRLNTQNIPFNYSVTDNQKDAVFNIFCYTKAQSRKLKKSIEDLNAKYFITENKFSL